MEQAEDEGAEAAEAKPMVEAEDEGAKAVEALAPSANRDRRRKADDDLGTYEGTCRLFEKADIGGAARTNHDLIPHF